MKSSGFFLLGIAVGATGVLLFNRLRSEMDPEDAERLSKRVVEHLRQLEDRLDSLMVNKAREAV